MVKSVKAINCDSKESRSSDSDENVFVGNIKICNYCKDNCHQGNKMFNEIINIEGENVKIKIDTGADVSIMPLQIFKLVNCQSEI